MQEFGPAVITEAADVDTLQFDWGTIQMLSDGHSTGAESSSFGLVHIEPGDGHERHNHPGSDEIIYVLVGTGEQMLNDEEAVAIGPGDCMYIPSGVYHGTENTGGEVMRLLVVYTPAGPEEQFRGMDACTIVPPEGP
jgi:oxalate decarboxylase/phosphoglucose isomerase-like protein (cupin superfamily)